ncbi:hypothetical protein B0T10DRAFT_595661 [Thelonectria olida]|uniref:Uncharacterized protein n=1 Tax=Thelonectria olida TaxID=1576542 RepID=A0A9P8W7Q7_9HYPO|nr:hypothetical protein B0T10DRAFT_595661 [Thelonectria olida]
MSPPQFPKNTNMPKPKVIKVVVPSKATVTKKGTVSKQLPDTKKPKKPTKPKHKTPKAKPRANKSTPIKQLLPATTKSDTPNEATPTKKPVTGNEPVANVAPVRKLIFKRSTPKTIPTKKKDSSIEVLGTSISAMNTDRHATLKCAYDAYLEGRILPVNPIVAPSLVHLHRDQLIVRAERDPKTGELLDLEDPKEKWVVFKGEISLFNKFIDFAMSVTQDSAIIVGFKPVSEIRFPRTGLENGLDYATFASRVEVVEYIIYAIDEDNDNRASDSNHVTSTTAKPNIASPVDMVKETMWRSSQIRANTQLSRNHKKLIRLVSRKTSSPPSITDTPINSSRGRRVVKLLTRKGRELKAAAGSSTEEHEGTRPEY